MKIIVGIVKTIGYIACWIIAGCLFIVLSTFIAGTLGMISDGIIASPDRFGFLLAGWILTWKLFRWIIRWIKR